jgi:hypothetical protein
MTGQSNSGALLMGFAAAAALALCIYNYVTPFTGIDGTPGALLVIVSTTLLVLLAVALQLGHGGGRALHGFLLVASMADIAGTAFAGWLLESRALVALMAVCLIGWLMVALRPRPAII